MIYKSISVEVDEQTNIGIFGEQYLRFDGDNYIGVIPEDEVLRTYVTAGVRIPDQFVAVRQKLQALL